MKSPSVIYEDEDFAAVYKPSGLRVHKAQSEKGGGPTLVDWLIERYPELKTVGDDTVTRPGIVHRIDQGASGILLVPRNQRSFVYFKDLFKKRLITKFYLALVYGEVRQNKGTITSLISLKPGSLKRTVHKGKETREALTEYEVLEPRSAPETNKKESELTLLTIRIITGRTHQIRVHLASIGHPVVGDYLYGSKKQPAWAKRLMLHAWSLEFTGPKGERLHLEAEPPEEFRF